MTQGEKFAVIYLPKEELYSEIPVSWLIQGRKKCRWPNTLNARSYMNRGDIPDETWDIHEVQVEEYCSTLASARRKAEDPNYYSSSAENKGRGLRKKKNRIYSFEEDTSDSDARTDTPLPEAPVFKSKIAQKTPSKCISEPTFVDVNESEYLQGDNYNICATSLENQLDGKNLRPVTATRDDTMRSCNASGSDSTLVLLSEKAIENIQKDNTTGVLQAEKGSTSTRTLLNEKDAETIQKDESVCASSSNKSQACVLNEIYIKIIKMEKLMENMSKSLSCLNVTNSNSTQHMELINVLPLKTHNDIFDFEKQNEDHEFRKAFMNFITNIGGKDIKDFVNRTLGHMFTNSLGKSCSLVGHRGNLRLDGFNFMQVLQDVILMQKPSNKYEIEKCIGEWFRLSNQRLTRTNKKKQNVDITKV